MQILRLLVKNAFRHKLRTVLTALGIAVAILAFGLLRTTVGAWYAGVEASSATRLVTRNAISLIFPLPLSYQEKIRQVPGVKNVSYAYWFAGVYISEKNFFPNLALDPKSFYELWPEYVLSEQEKEAFLRDRKACIAGRKAAERFGWKIGDSITLKGTIFPGNFTFTLKGIYHGAHKGVDETALFFQWAYLNESLKKTAPSRADHVGWFTVQVADPAHAAEVAQAIDRTFKNSLAETLTETEKAFQLGFVSMTEAIIVAVKVVSLVVIVIIMAVMANTMAMNARERIGEYAVLKTLGFDGRHIAGLIIGESLVIAFLGCALGIGLTYPAASAFGKAMSMYLPVFEVRPETIYLDLMATLVVGLTAAAFPAWQAVKLPIAEGLRKIG
jgi:putative ABC transport system permease protein